MTTTSGTNDILVNNLGYAKYPDDIFIITNEYYDFVIDNNLEYITKNMFTSFDYFYTNCEY